ncbi:MAG: UPF0147 family protein [Candidatus Marsarchaeota archaeon]|nr:UPF0147 family protein [Candidatus Marsarchaeota archaeon]
MALKIGNDEKIKQAVVILQQISDDNTIPRNIRKTAQEASRVLQAKNLTAGVKAANAISVIDQISQDPNMPPHTRVQLWQVASTLETIKD